MSAVDFVDTCWLLNNYDKLETYSHFYLASTTLLELNSIKESRVKDDNTKFRARKVSRWLLENSTRYTCILVDDNVIKICKKKKLNPEVNDYLICSAAEYLRKQNKINIAFHTDDVLCAEVARQYFPFFVCYSERTASEEIYKGYIELSGNTEQINQFFESPPEMVMNQYLLIYDESQDKESEMRWDGEKFVELRLPPSEVVKAKNALQRCALDMLNNKDITICGILGGYGSGKAQPVDTIIPTPDGEKRFGDLKIGDYVFDEKGEPTKVIGIYPQGVIDNYRVTFKDGRISYCNDEHLWTYFTSKGNYNTITVKEMLRYGIKKISNPETRGGSYKYKIPRTLPVKYPEKDFLIDPYVMGILLGDGCLKEKPLTISSSDEEIIRECSKLLKAEGYKRNSLNNYSWIFYGDLNRLKSTRKDASRLLTKEVLKDFPSLIGANSLEKSIPEEYFYGSISQRFSLLQGLLDSDGTIDPLKGRIRFTSTNLTLIQQVQKLCFSLGLSASITKDGRNEKYTAGICYGLQISCNNSLKPNLFRLKRKKDIALAISTKKGRLGNGITITNIEKMPEPVEMMCIMVDNPNHLYLTNDYIVTHNTFLATTVALYKVTKKGEQGKVLIVREPFGEGKEIGFLPGSKDNKMKDFFLPIAQQLSMGEDEFNELQDNHTLITNSPYFMKGTTYNDTVIICDEAEDLSAKQIRLIGTRLGEDSRIFFSGDYKQSVINPTEHNALVEMCNQFKGESKFACIYLGEDVRSETSKLFANLWTE